MQSRTGISAGLLLNGRWVLPYAERGFDLLTYKTVRSAARPCYPLPNWVFVEESGGRGGPIYVTETPPNDVSLISSSVCFGMPSLSPEEWREDFFQAGAAAVLCGSSPAYHPDLAIEVRRLHPEW